MTQISGAIGGVIVPPSVQTIQQFDYNVNLLQSLLWQQTEAVNLQGILTAKQAWYDANQTAFWQDWYTNVFNVDTANQFGLSVWGIILDIPLYIANPPSNNPRFGFAPEDVNFSFGNLEPEGGLNYQLPLETQRRAIKLRYAQLVSSGCVPEINRALKYVFSDLGAASLYDYGNMTQRYIFNFPLTYDLLYLFNNFDILPRPSGVRSVYYDATIQYFGFAPEDTNFYNGNCYEDPL